MTHKEFSSKGGRAGTGKAKARTTEQARAAALARWGETLAEEKGATMTRHPHGKARAKNLSAGKRKQIAKNAARARWKKEKARK